MVLSNTIENFDSQSKVSSFKIVSTNLSSNSNSILISIRKNGYFDYQSIYNKKIEFGMETVEYVKPITEEEIKDILYFISRDKQALCLFKEYLNELEKLKEKDIKPAISKDDEKNVFPKEQTTGIFEITKAKEELIENSENGIVKKFYYRQNRLNRFIGLVIDTDLQPIYMSSYCEKNGALFLESEMKRKITEEEIECIKSFISDNKDAMNIFNEYLLKIQNKIR